MSTRKHGRLALAFCIAAVMSLFLGFTAFAATEGFVIHKTDDGGTPLEGVPFEVYGKPALSYERAGTVDVVASKTWDDVDNADGSRPSSVTVHLLANGDETASCEMAEEDGWSYTFADLDKYDADGNEISYTITEDEVEGYTTTIDGYAITNTHEPASTSLSVTKTTLSYLTYYNNEAIINGNIEIPTWDYFYTDAPKLTLYRYDEATGTNVEIGSFSQTSSETENAFTLYRAGTYYLKEDVGADSEHMGEDAADTRGSLAWFGYSIYLDCLEFEVYEGDDGSLQINQTGLQMKARPLTQESVKDIVATDDSAFGPESSYLTMVCELKGKENVLQVIGGDYPSVQQDSDGTYSVTVMNALIPGIGYGMKIA